MAKTFNYGAGIWATKTGSSMAYNDQNDNYKPVPFSVTRDSIATRVNKQGLIEVVGKDKLRIDYTDSSNGVALLEPSRTNLVTYSEELSNWTQDGTSTIDNSTISPDGTQNASKINFNSGNERIYVLFTTSNTSYSGYFKGVEGTKIKFRDNNNSTFTEITLTENWVRHEFYKSANNTNIQIQNVNSDYVYAWGIQAEAGSYATSYIPTSGQSGGVTRAADVANGAGNEQVFNDSEGVLFADMTALADDSTNKVITLSDGTTSNRVQVYFNSSNGITGAVAGQASISYSTNIKLNSKVAFKYKTNDFALWVSGFKVGTDVIGSSPSGLKEIDFDNGSGASNYYGKTKELAYYDTALTDAELEALTSYTSFTNMANELNLTIK
jgi:hypothetical protein